MEKNGGTGLVFFRNQFYLALTDTRCVELNGQLHVPLCRGWRSAIRVRSETAKVTWPSRRETLISTVMVVAMAFLAALFFFVADQVMAYGVEFVLGLGR